MSVRLNTFSNAEPREVIKAYHGVFCVLSRNFIYMKYTFFVSALWLIFEPIIYLLAIGLGVGHLIGDIKGVLYFDFFAPALMIITAMYAAFYESSYGVYNRLYEKHTHNQMVMTPIDPHEIALGEILWSVLKAMASSFVVYIIALFHIDDFSILSINIFVNCFLVAWVFSALGLVVNTYVKSQDWFVFIQSGLLVPMALVCGTYFPLSYLPSGLENMVKVLPISLSVSTSRSLFMGEMTSDYVLNIIVMSALAIILTRFSVKRFSRKLLK